MLLASALIVLVISLTIFLLAILVSLIADILRY